MLHKGIDVKDSAVYNITQSAKATSWNWPINLIDHLVLFIWMGSDNRSVNFKDKKK